jgi:hypothetical protein
LLRWVPGRDEFSLVYALVLLDIVVPGQQPLGCVVGKYEKITSTEG